MYEYDESGRLVRSVTTTEPEWDEDEQNWMLALAECRDLTCSGCGGWLPETTTVEAERWTVPPPTRCGKCTAIGIAQDRHAEDHQQLHATRWSAQRR